METNELTPRILKMTTKTGFVELFWEAVNADQQQHTHEEIYDIPVSYTHLTLPTN